MARKGVELARKLYNVHLKIVGCSTIGTGSTVALDIEKSRYLFNCEENVERLFIEGNIPNRIDALKAVFVTYPKWERFVSVPNYVTSTDTGDMRTVKRNKFKLYTAKSELVRRTLSIVGNKYKKEAWNIIDVKSRDSSYRDDNITVTPVVISREKSGSERCGNYLDTIVGYYGVLRDCPGEIRTDKLEELGLQKEFKEVKDLLKSISNSIMTDKGVRICKNDILTPTTTGASFLIIECPDKEFIRPIISNKTLQTFQQTADQKVLKVVIHIVPQFIIKNSLYTDWMNKFDRSTEHIFVLTDHKGNIPVYGYKMRCVLNLVSPTLYPITRHSLALPRLPEICENIHIAEDNCSFNLTPGIKQPFSYQVARLPKQTNVMQECYEHIQDCFNFYQTAVYEREIAPGVVINTSEKNENLQKITPMQHHQKLINNNNKLDLTPVIGDPLISFVGTGSAGATSYRNTSCILIIDAAKNSYILDCGVGSYMQMWDMFRERTNEILANLKFIFVSHRHIDHHSGIARLLQERANLVGHNVLVIGPGILKDKLMYYSKNVEDLKIEFMELRELQKGVNKELSKQLCMRELTTIRVEHCYDAHGVSMVHKEGWKVVYSGDTRPTEELARVGTNADLLIHEATFGRGLEEHAKFKKHSTTPEAILIGQKMQAKYTILTHFSHRYNKLPKFEEVFVTGNVRVAFDNMTFLLSQLYLGKYAQETIRDFIPKYIKEASGMSVRDMQWDSLDSWERYDPDD
ncbi:Zinc phosphodiesterase ELAC protein 2 [Oopsacas minuta]|uniref:ribonuclease Z n=1 Tax=Oopsacas minuta TaxID=111878 RepID=A0AAV7KCM3_9METZ|nr:Zinc phosphodiesterase ELAC protein 2 [Oopsacas minuta]